MKEKHFTHTVLYPIKRNLQCLQSTMYSEVRPGSLPSYVSSRLISAVIAGGKQSLYSSSYTLTFTASPVCCAASTASPVLS